MKNCKTRILISKENPMTHAQTRFVDSQIRTTRPWRWKFGTSLVHGCWCGVLLAGLCVNAQYASDWFTIDGGGGPSSGGSYTLNGTIGQPDANLLTLTGGSYTLEGGFLPGLIVPSSSGAPTLFIRLSGALEQSNSLLPGSWVATPAGETNPATIPFGAGPTFYRLRKP